MCGCEAASGACLDKVLIFFLHTIVRRECIPLIWEFVSFGASKRHAEIMNECLMTISLNFYARSFTHVPTSASAK